MYVKYAMDAFTVGYQTSEVDGQTATQEDEATMMSVSYAVTDDLSVSYGIAEVDLGSSTTDQESKGISASYTMGGMTIGGHMNQNDNVGGSSAVSADKESYEFSLGFSF